MSDGLGKHVLEMRSAPKDAPWSDWFLEGVPADLFTVVTKMGQGVTVMYTYANGFRDEFRAGVSLPERTAE